MNNINNDTAFNSIVSDILDNHEFNKIKNIEHHGTTRYIHSLKVSYLSYRLAKILGLNYQEVARGGLLHDFFLSDENRTKKDRVISTFVHPGKAVIKASENFVISKKEEDIIKSHMFPINPNVPKFAESWLVSIVDKTIGAFEFAQKYKHKLNYALNLCLLILINSID